MIHPLGLFRYQSFSVADYERFMKEFVVNMDDPEIHSWAAPDYGRLGLTPADSESSLFTAWVTGARRTGEGFVFDLLLPERPRRLYGAPAACQLIYTFPTGEPWIRVELAWFQKPANRMPEASWLSFCPPVGAEDAWEMQKLGRWVSPLKIVSRGNRSMHGVGEGVRVTRGTSRLLIETEDAHLVSPGKPRLLQFDNTLPDPAGGMHFCLHANLYSTNFPLWYEDDARFRFWLRFGGMTPPSMGGDCDLREASRRVGDRLFFMGGFDQNAGFERGSPEAARRLVVKCFEATRDHAGYICVPSDHFFFGDPANIQAFADACRECRY